MPSDMSYGPAPRGLLHLKLVGFPATCFAGALLTDIAYSKTADIQWANFSAWLLAFAMLLSAVVGLAGLFDLYAARWFRHRHLTGPYVAMVVVVLLLGLFNNFIHSRDAWTSVVPAGLILSAVTVLAMLVTLGIGIALFRRPNMEAVR